jgi:hypothetical protein
MTALPDPTVDLDWSGYVCSSLMTAGLEIFEANPNIDIGRINSRYFRPKWYVQIYLNSINRLFNFHL